MFRAISLCLLTILLSTSSVYSHNKPRPVVGFNTVHYFDQKRERPLIADIYYPVKDKQIGQVEHDIMVRAMRAPTVEMRNPNSKHPLIILSHGYGGSREHLTWLAESLSQKGYIVAALDHFGNTSYFDTPDIALQRWSRPQDVSAFLDHFLKDPQWSAVIDTDKIGFAGYSLGGMAGIWLAGGIADEFQVPNAKTSSIYELSLGATQANIDKIDYTLAKKSYKDKRIKAFLLIAPAQGQVFSEKSLASIKAPVFIVATKNDKIAPLPDTFKKAIPGVKLKLYEGDISHVTFRNGILEDKKVCASSLEFDLSSNNIIEKVHKEIAEMALAFFNKNLEKRQQKKL